MAIIVRDAYEPHANLSCPWWLNFTGRGGEGRKEGARGRRETGVGGEEGAGTPEGGGAGCRLREPVWRCGGVLSSVVERRD